MNTVMTARKPHPWMVGWNQQKALERAKKLGELRVRAERYHEDHADPVYAEAQRATARKSYHNRKNKGVVTPAKGEKE